MTEAVMTGQFDCQCSAVSALGGLGPSLTQQHIGIIVFVPACRSHGKGQFIL